MAFSFTDNVVTNLLSTALGALSVSCVSDEAREIISGQLDDIEYALSCSRSRGDADE